MMPCKRIAICTAQIPFEHGGAEILAESSVRELRKRGYAVDLVRVPFRWYPKEEILKGYLAWRLLDLTESEGKPIDLVIALKFPSFAVRHPNKIVWLVQQFRQAYDLFSTEHSYFTTSPEDERLRQCIHRIDTQTLAESRRRFAISRNVAQRLARYNGLQAEPLYPPPTHEGLYRNDGYGNYVLVVNRLNVIKRTHLIIKAIAHVRGGARLLIAGRGPEEQRLKDLTHRLGATERVEFLGYVDGNMLLDLYANCFALFYGPLDEDYGLATVEAFKSQKPVLTMADSGGVLEFVEDGYTGYVVLPTDLRQLAARIDELYADRERCRRMGMQGYQAVEHINWDQTIQRLVEG